MGGGSWGVAALGLGRAAAPSSATGQRLAQDRRLVQEGQNSSRKEAGVLDFSAAAGAYPDRSSVSRFSLDFKKIWILAALGASARRMAFSQGFWHFFKKRDAAVTDGDTSTV